MKKKIISLLLLIVTSFVLLTACNNEDPQKYTITYMLDNETVLSTDTGTSIYKKPIPAKKGFHFINWYTKPDFSSVPIVFPFKIEQDITAYAKFEKGIFNYDILSNNTECIIRNLYYCQLDKDIIIPSKIDGYDVKSINTSISEKDYITSIKFEKNIIVSNLQISLENINTIDLSNLHSLKNISIGSCNKLTSLILPDTDKIYSYFLMLCTGIDNITLPTTLTEIYKNAFSGLIKLKSIDIPASVTKINSEAFYNCIALEKINILSNDMIDLGNVDNKISNSDKTVIYVKSNLLEAYQSKYKNMTFQAIK